MMIIGCDFHTRYQQIAMMNDAGGWPRFGFALNLILNRILNLFLTLTSSEGCPMFVPPGFSGGRTWGPSYPS